MKRLLLGLGTVATVTLPVAGVVACGSKSDASTAKQQAPQTQGVARSTKPTVNVEATYEGTFVANATRITLSNVQITDLVANVLKASAVFMEKSQQADYLAKVANLKTLAPTYVDLVSKVMKKPMDGSFVNDLPTAFSASNAKSFSADINVIFDLVTAVLKGNNVGGFVTIIKNELAKVFTNEAQFNEIINSKMFGLINSPIVQGMLPTITSIISPAMNDVKELFSSLLEVLQPVASDKALINILHTVLVDGIGMDISGFAGKMFTEQEDKVYQLLGKISALAYFVKEKTILSGNKLKMYLDELLTVTESKTTPTNKQSSDLRNTLVHPLATHSIYAGLSASLAFDLMGAMGGTIFPIKSWNIMLGLKTKAEWDAEIAGKLSRHDAELEALELKKIQYDTDRKAWVADPANQAKPFLEADPSAVLPERITWEAAKTTWMNNHPIKSLDTWLAEKNTNHVSDHNGVYNGKLVHGSGTTDIFIADPGSLDYYNIYVQASQYEFQKGDAKPAPAPQAPGHEGWLTRKDAWESKPENQAKPFAETFPVDEEVFSVKWLNLATKSVDAYFDALAADSNLSPMLVPLAQGVEAMNIKNDGQGVIYNILKKYVTSDEQTKLDAKIGEMQAAYCPLVVKGIKEGVDSIVNSISDKDQQAKLRVFTDSWKQALSSAGRATLFPLIFKPIRGLMGVARVGVGEMAGNHWVINSGPVKPLAKVGLEAGMNILKIYGN